MKKIITENPNNNTEAMHNMVFGKDGEVYLRGIGEDYTDISLVDFCKEEYKRLYDIEIEESDPCEFGEYMDDDSLLSLFYWACVGFAEVREKLKYYEESLGDTTVGEIKETIARNCVAWDTSKDKTQGLLPEVAVFKNPYLYEKLTGEEYNFSKACKKFHIG
ncbi:hypothetical protein FDC45_17805 [Clostridium botulinum]|uniref:Uncharacterized protein n=1 Tax=Clostridium botulinum TaxID=1491 RepID=A0A846JCM7_CLOBO|nr:hypothetical protein [Clostridium botulinum]ACA57370.1 hypothetical protein CLK_A0249 [Clostridium botulinum A3 str. Loch Maree]NFH67024.1 hypothetical protein [Clostridium botulinum]NFJ09613.1 hypothetical protein [Clostridium botulinum]NFK16582.1 hypothetical protein [Clostridium botulinum]NFM94307.1 hypothetical protein [Clostridium botulinum]